ncbi:MAG: Acyl-CoA thioesterase [Pseudomonadota bacterium]|jgi:acyl-CoA thioesterase|nr:Acyl-CoA thioesterase [Pseudomonadota bacterium]
MNEPFPHPFDQAVALQQQADGSWLGHTSPAYANMVGPFGGISAAQLLQAVWLHPQRLGEPVALTVNFAVALQAGPFQIEAIAVRTNRSTQHWTLAMRQHGEVCMTGTAITAVRRDTWSVDDEAMPDAPAPQDVSPGLGPVPMEWIKRYEIRPFIGAIPKVWDGSGESSLSRLWVRDQPPRALDFAALAALADVFFPRVFVRRATLVPIGTISLSVYFHAGAADLHTTGEGYLLGQARAKAFRNGYFDQTGLLWNSAGRLLATTHQVVYYKS